MTYTKTITLTAKQASLLATYILITTKYREDQIAACAKLAEEKNGDGTPRYPAMSSNADWWRETHTEMERIYQIIHEFPVSE
jgi:hypothetical protein